MRSHRIEAVIVAAGLAFSAKAVTAGAEVRQEAAADKLAADEFAAGDAVVKEKRDVLAGEAKDRCVADAKGRFGQR